MKTGLIAFMMLSCILTSFAQNQNNGGEFLGTTVYYQETCTIQGDGYEYQCDVPYASLITLYNKQNKLTYERIVYKDTGRPYSPKGWLEKGIVESDRSMDFKAEQIVDQAFSKNMVKEFGNEELMIVMLLNPDTGNVLEVYFQFFLSSPFCRVPISYFREIEVKLKEQVRFTPGPTGKRFNFIMMGWMQTPKGRFTVVLPPNDSGLISP